MNRIKLVINRAIAEIESIYPQDNLISCYKDFLKHRDVLHYYQYNEAVVISLIDLTHKLWHTNERISRASLIDVSKRYFKKANTKENILPQTASKIFELFKEIIYHENLNMSKESVDRAQKAINSIMIGIRLKEKELQWLCEHSNHSKYILNRLLRYHLKSKAITNWAKKNFEKDFARSRRSEMTSWLIDEVPDFKIDKETVEFDFAYQIIEDKKIVDVYINELDDYYFLEKQARSLASSEDDLFIYDGGFEYNSIGQAKPIIELPRRHYGGFIKMHSKYEHIPDFDYIHKDFYDKFNFYYKRIMIWSIAYSRLSVHEKIKQFSKYYSNELYPSFFIIGKKLKSVEYFNWLKQMAC